MQGAFRMDWLDLLAVQGLSRVFSNTTAQKHQFFSTQLSSSIGTSLSSSWVSINKGPLSVCPARLFFPSLFLPFSIRPFQFRASVSFLVDISFPAVVFRAKERVDFSRRVTVCSCRCSCAHLEGKPLYNTAGTLKRL